MPHNYKEGINWVSDPTGQTALINHTFVSKGGDNSNTGTSPNTPVLTIDNARTKTNTVSGVIVIGSGLYSERVTSQTAGMTLKGDKTVIIKNPDGGILPFIPIGTGVPRVENLIFVDWVKVFTAQSGVSTNGNVTFIKNCLVIGGEIEQRFAGFNSSTKAELKNCRFVNASFIVPNSEYTIPTGEISNNIFWNSTANLSGDTLNLLIYFRNNFVGGKLTCLAHHVTKITNCCINGQVQVGATTYNNLADAKAAYPAGFDGCFSIDAPQFNNPQKYDFSVRNSSALLGSGYQGTSIGGVSSGLPFDYQTPELSNLATFTDAEFNEENEIVVANGGTSGTIVSGIRDIGRVATLGRISTKGISDYLNHVPDSINTSDRPNKLSFEMRWAVTGEDIATKIWKHFLWDEIPCLDSTGKSNAESGFTWSSTSNIQARYIQFRLTLINNYIVA